MTSTLKSGLAAALGFGALTLGALTLGAPAASAMPLGFAPAIQDAQIEAVRWVCGPYRCHWRPNYRRHHHHHRHHGWRHW
jgi:hypothetical protein